jgi:Protein of unknown function (DUF1353)
MRSTTRRGVLVGAAGMASLAGGGRRHAALGGGRSLTKQEWMDRVLAQLKTKGVETGGLRLGRFKDPMYFLLNPIQWRPGDGDNPNLPHVEVPAGFVTDLASIPRLFWSLLRPDGDYVYAAILHDYLYWEQTTSKSTADMVLKIGMMDLGVSDIVVTTIYQAVRLAGQSAWDDNTKLKAGGERRILVQFPDDPRVTWSQWKRRPAVFGT